MLLTKKFYLLFLGLMPLLTFAAYSMTTDTTTSTTSEDEQAIIDQLNSRLNEGTNDAEQNNLMLEQEKNNTQTILPLLVKHDRRKEIQKLFKTLEHNPQELTEAMFKKYFGCTGTPYYVTPLMLACYYKQEKILSIMLEALSTLPEKIQENIIKHKNDDASSALTLAITFNFKPGVELILQVLGKNNLKNEVTIITEQASRQESPLLYATDPKLQDILRYFLAKIERCMTTATDEQLKPTIITEYKNILHESISYQDDSSILEIILSSLHASLQQDPQVIVEVLTHQEFEHLQSPLLKVIVKQNEQQLAIFFDFLNTKLSKNFALAILRKKISPKDYSLLAMSLSINTSTNFLAILLDHIMTIFNKDFPSFLLLLINDNKYSPLVLMMINRPNRINLIINSVLNHPATDNSILLKALTQKVSYSDEATDTNLLAIAMHLREKQILSLSKNNHHETLYLTLYNFMKNLCDDEEENRKILTQVDGVGMTLMHQAALKQHSPTFNLHHGELQLLHLVAQSG